MKNKCQKINEKLFDWNYYIYYGVSQEFMIKDAEKKGIKNIEYLNCNLVPGRCLLTDSNLIIIWTLKKDIPILAHEIFHAVSMSLLTKGLSLTESSEETFCYLTQFLFEEILSYNKK